MRPVIHSAAPCAPDVKRRMLDWWGPVINENYAASEGGGTQITRPQWLARPGSVGRPLPVPRFTCSSPRATTCPPGSRAGSTCAWAAASTTTTTRRRRAPRAPATFTVGDIGYLDADGYLYLCDRPSDMIISGGVNIYPAEIEAEPPAIRRSRRGRVRCARTTSGAKRSRPWSSPLPVLFAPELTADLLAFLDIRLARFKLPRSIDYVTELPRDPNGKLYKRRLRDLDRACAYRSI